MTVLVNGGGLICNSIKSLRILIENLYNLPTVQRVSLAPPMT